MFRNLDQTQISYYCGVTSKKKEKDISIADFIDTLKNGTFQTQIEKIRGLTGEEQKLYKRKLPAVTLSGTFSESHKREDLLKHSGLIQIDIDQINELDNLKSQLYNDPFTFCGFVSPSGSGLKLIVKISDDHTLHLTHFLGLQKYYKYNYHIEIDPACKDVCRLCFVSYDKDLYLNKESEIFSHEVEINWDESKTETSILPIIKDDKDYYFNSSNFEDFVLEIENQNIILANTYDEWRNLAFAISNKFGLKGFDYFDRISSLCPKYDKNKIEDQFFLFLKDNNGTIEIKTVFSMAKRAGLKIPNQNKPQNMKEDKKNLSKVEIIKNYISDKYIIRNNIVSCSIQWKEKGSETYRDFNENDLYLELLENNYQVGLPLIKAIIQSSWIEQYNPFVEYLEDLPKWDGITDHISNLLSYLKLDQTNNFSPTYHFKKWFVRVVKCMLDQTYFNKQMIVLIQEQQNGGKSTFCRFLCPDTLRNYYTESIANGKDENIQLATNFLICYDELSKMTKTDIQQIKSLMSTLNINVRLPYASRQTLLNRRSSFIGNTNNIEFLDDETGSIRFICFKLLDKIDFSYREKVNINEVYAQAYSLLKSGSFEYDLNNDDSQNIQNYNTKFQVLTPERELLYKYFEPCLENDPNCEYLNNTDILTYLQTQAPAIKLKFKELGKSLILLEYKRTNKRLEPLKNPSYVYILKKKNG